MIYNISKKCNQKIFDESTLKEFNRILRTYLITVLTKRREQVPVSMAVGNVELLLECFLKHLRVGTGRMKYDTETEEEGKKE